MREGPGAAAGVRSSRWAGGLAAVLVLLVVLCYANALRTPFVFDDFAAIRDNPTIRDLGSIATVLSPPGGGRTVAGRPLVNLTFALNHAIGGEDPVGYHVFNVLVHVAASLALFGLLRRCFALPGLPPRVGPHALPLALVATACWALHPLQTESVTYVAQRAESLAALFCLVSFYAFVRGTAAGARRPRWLVASVIAGVAGAATKETAVVVPLLVILFDVVFVAGSWREAWRQRRGYYASLALVWLLTAALLWRMGLARGSSAGFGTGMTVSGYLGQQMYAIVRYLRLTIWPSPLVFDYGTAVPGSWWEIWPYALLVAGAFGVAAWLLVRTPRIGFLAAAFLLLLAPSSSFVPVASQTMAEHRMYLPLATASVGCFLALAAWLGARGAVAIGAALALMGGAGTWARNRDYRSELALWADTAGKVPDNPRALSNYASALLDAGRPAEAVTVLARAAALQPNSPEIHSNRSLALLRAGRVVDAIESGRRAVALASRDAAARVNLGSALVAAERWPEATSELLRALQLQPDATDVRRLLATVHARHAQALLRGGERAAAQAEIAAGLDVSPAVPELHFIAGNLRAAERDFPAAIAAYRRAVTLDPHHARARNNLANALLVIGDVGGAIGEYRASLEVQPDQPATRENLDAALTLLRGSSGN